MMSYVFGTDAADATTQKPVKDICSDTASDSDDEICLQSRFPSISQAEIDQFKKHFVKEDGDMDDVVKKLEECVEFRAMYGLSSPENETAAEEDDATVWEWASKTAIEAAKTNPVLIPGLEGCVPFEDRKCDVESFKQNAHCYKNDDGTPARTKDGHPVIHYMSAILDLDVVSKEIHALALALYLQRKAGPIGLDDGGYFLVDVREGAGWRNHNVLSVVGFIQTLSAALHKLHPGRMSKMIIYPVPYTLVYVFHMLQGWLPTAISENIVLVDGPDGKEEPAPTEELSKYVEIEILEKMEKTRRAMYKY